MRIDVAPCAGGLADRDLAPWRVVVIDALRASSTVAQAIESEARRVLPIATVKEARACKAALAGEGALLGGERGGLPPAGFDLGNSPAEYTPERIRGKTIVLTTTNGAAAILACRSAKECLVGAFVNLPAVAEYLARRGGDVLLAAVGREGAPVLDDTVCAGMYAVRLTALVPDAALTAAARKAQEVYRRHEGRIEEALRESASGRALIRAGLGADLAWCARVGRCGAVPRLADGEVRQAEAG